MDTGENDRTGGFVFVSTPIGNFGDLSDRAAKTLKQSQTWLVEDTRVSGKLASFLGVRPSMHLLNEQTSPHQLEKFLALAQRGGEIAIITDGGSPVISDPGARICDEAYRHELSVDVVPGPSAVVTALTLSGFYAQKFAFLGFLARKSGAIKSELLEYEHSTLTLVVFESPYRLEATLHAIAEVLAGRRYAICRELTKPYQQVWRGTFPEIPDEDKCPRKGEFTIVIEGRRSSRSVMNLG